MSGSVTAPTTISTQHAILVVLDNLSDGLATFADGAMADPSVGREEADRLTSEAMRKWPDAVRLLRSLLGSGAVKSFRENSMPFGARWIVMDAPFWTTSQADGVLENGWIYADGRPQAFHHLARQSVVMIDVATLDKWASSQPGETATAPPQSPKNRARGWKPTTFDRVVAAMRELPRDRLDQMLEKEMEALFRASRDTCRRARIAVLHPSDN